MDGDLAACRSARQYFSTSVSFGVDSLRQAQGTWFVCCHARPYAPTLAFSVRTLPELVEGAASQRMEPKVGDEEHVRSDYPREKW